MTVMAQGPRRRGRPERFNERREEVLRAAARVFSAHGFKQATLEDIAGALDMTRPALYHYASSKDELLSECAEIAQADLRAAVAEARAERTGAAQLRAFFHRYAQIICDDFGRCFVLTDRREMNPAEQALNRRRQRELSDAVQAMIADGAADGSLRPVDPGDASRAIFAAFNGIPRWRTDAGRSPVEISERFLDLFLTGIRAEEASGGGPGHLG